MYKEMLITFNPSPCFNYNKKVLSRLNLKAINFIFLDNNRHHHRRRFYKSVCVVCLQLQIVYMQNKIEKIGEKMRHEKKKYYTWHVCACFCIKLLLFLNVINSTATLKKLTM